MDTIDLFLAAHGCEHSPKHYTTGEWINLPAPGKKPSNRSAGLFIDHDGQSATLKLHTTGTTHYWRSDEYREPSPADRRRDKKRQAAKARADRQKRTKAASIARTIIGKAERGRAAPYGERKGINPDLYLSDGDNVIVPIYYRGKLVNVQTIKPEKYDGNDKWPIKGGLFEAGIYHQLGENNETAIVCEGWATGARLHQITGHTVIVTFTAGNLERFKKPAWCKRLLVAVDNDKSRRGEQAADKLQKRYPDSISVLPPTIGTDWADYTRDEVLHYWREHLPATLTIRERYLPARVLDLADHLVIKSPHETGKTTAIIEACKKSYSDHSILIVCHGRCQVSDMVDRLAAEGLTFIDYRTINDVNATDHLVICVDSTWKLRRGFDLKVFDECEQLCEAPLKHDLHAAQSNPAARRELAHNIAWLARQAKKTIWVDADAGDLTDQMIKHAELDVMRIENTYKTMEGARIEFVGLDTSDAGMANDKSQWHYYTPAPKTAGASHRKYGGILAIGETDNSDLLHRISNGDPITENLVTNSALQSGVSIDVDQHQIKTVYARLKVGPGLPSLEAQLQAMRRARGVQRFVICVESKAPEHEYCTDPERIVRDDIIDPIQHNRAWLKRRELVTSSPLTGINIDPVLSDLYSHNKAKLHHQWNDPRQWLCDRLAELGATVVESVSVSDTGEQTRKRDRKLLNDIKAEDLNVIATADIPTEAEHRQGIKNKALAALASARYDARADSDIEARKLAQREYLKPGYLKGLNRCKRDMRPETVHAREDLERAEIGDPMNLAKRSRLTAMRKEVIGICAHVLDGREFSAGDLESVLRPWLIENGRMFAMMSGRRCGDPAKMRAAQTLVTLLESYGIWIDRIDGEQKRYSINPDDPRNAIATRMLLTYCISKEKNDSKKVTRIHGTALFRSIICSPDVVSGSVGPM